jgi:hypothetical protein
LWTTIRQYQQLRDKAFKLRNGSLEIMRTNSAIAKGTDLPDGKISDSPVNFQRPNDGTAGAQKIGEQNFLGGGNSNYGAMFANKITVDCS